jgi:hypothetical protein
MSQGSFVSTLASLTIAWSVVACTGKSDPEGSGTGDTGSGGIPTGGVTADASNSDPSADDGDGSGGGSGDSTASPPTTSADGSDSTADGSGGSDGTGTNDPGDPLDCSGTNYACGNGEDDDKDGFIDLLDPECTGPCDDDEATFQTGLPGDNVDCKQDCFFDGNSGQGDDGCIWDLRCDPANPGANVGCEYSGGNNCNNQPPNQTEDCVMFCSQFVPPGCDCFGCCTVETPDGPLDIFLNSGPDCSLDNLEACQTCTSQIDDCGTPCVPEKCQVCFGETEPPEGCDDGMCPNEMLACESNAECPTDFYCLLGCCYPPPPG